VTHPGITHLRDLVLRQRAAELMAGSSCLYPSHGGLPAWTSPTDRVLGVVDLGGGSPLRLVVLRASEVEAPDVYAIGCLVRDGRVAWYVAGCSAERWRGYEAQARRELAREELAEVGAPW
jgi:hypothetical protein